MPDDPAPTRGRWTIQLCREGETFWAEIVDGPSYWDRAHDGKTLTVAPWPPVPGEAAIERVAMWLAYDYSTRGRPSAEDRWRLLKPVAQRRYRAKALAVLRAALAPTDP